MIRRLYPEAGTIDSEQALEEEYLPPPGPHVRANFVVSIDGMVEVGGRSSPLAGPADRAAYMAMRAVADVVLVGAGTVRAERYGPVRLDPAAGTRRRERLQPPLPALAIVSNRADLDPEDRVFSGQTKPLLITSAAAAAERTDLARVAEIVVCGDQHVDVTLAVEALHSRGMEHVLSEGGPTLLRSLIGAELLNELCCTTAPLLTGAGHRGLLGDEPLEGSVAWRLTGLLEGDGMILARYSHRGRP